MRFSEDRIEKLTCSDGIQRDIHIWEPETPKAVFLTIHGLFDHGGNYMNPGIYLREHGFATLAHNQHGHHQQKKAHVSRFEVFLDDLELMLVWVKEHFQGVPIFIMGHSMGGLIALHFGIMRFKGDPLVKGFILSSPSLENSIKTPGIVIKLARLLSAIAPKMRVPYGDLTQYVTRDKEIYERHRQDEKDGIMPAKGSARLAIEFLNAQDWVPEHILEWKHPMLVIVSGDDKLSNAAKTSELLSQIEGGLVTEVLYPDNYHENFNELNREEVFARIVEWAEPRIGE
ncbi:MAG: lysophospholipase [Bacteroidales bacterium]|nr:lysophospholipase [Bacteroidales bacterium]